MNVELFPLKYPADQLQRQDFELFSEAFAQRIAEKLPTVREVWFFGSGEEARAKLGSSFNARAAQLVETITAGEKFCGVVEKVLYFSFFFEDSEPVVVAATGADSLFLRRLDSEWLQGVRDSLERDFTLLREARINRETGLLNLANLLSVLDSWNAPTAAALLLVELPGRRQGFSGDQRHLERCTRWLRELVPDRPALHYLGHHTFALLRTVGEKGGSSHEFEKRLVRRLKHAGCHRVHIGSSLKAPANKEGGARALLDEAWTALQQAERRGPFSFCTWSLLTSPERHPLAPASVALRRKVGRRLAAEKVFSLLLLESDDKAKLLPTFAEELEGAVAISEDCCSAWFFFPGDDGTSALRFFEQLSGGGSQRSLSAGIATFPFCSFRRADIMQNCRKALIHAAFFGAGSAVQFDCVSLNISGDLYFGDGDLNSAVREYRRGLSCVSETAPTEEEVNLHNSLGVTCALMNRLPKAIEHFSAALHLEPDNFMALYNLGLALRDRGENDAALAALRRALEGLAAGKNADVDDETRRDLLLQLGTTACSCQHYREAAEHLRHWLELSAGRRDRGRVWRFLGEALYGLKEFRSCRDCLQKALQFDRFDATAMALLGDTYLQMGEGDEIALVLCRKSLELEPENCRFRILHARALDAAGEWEEARAELAACRKKRAWRSEATLALAELWLAHGEKRRAERLFARLLEWEKRGSLLFERASAGISDCL